jgi:NAD-dependent dihydropyrimidine dehydrogenase PreA subunit
MALFIAVEIDPALAQDAAAAKKLAEVCPVDIFAAGASGVQVVDKNLDECTLCELCLAIGKPGQVKIVKRYDGGATLQRAS